MLSDRQNQPAEERGSSMSGNTPMFCRNTTLEQAIMAVLRKTRFDGPVDASIFFGYLVDSLDDLAKNRKVTAMPSKAILDKITEMDTEGRLPRELKFLEDQPAATRLGLRRRHAIPAPPIIDPADERPAGKHRADPTPTVAR